MKKWTALFLCLLLIAVLAVPAMAAEVTQMTITAPVATAKPGDEITFEVSVSGSEACTSFGMILEYDRTVFEVVKGKCTLENAQLSIFDEEKGLAVLYGEETVPEGVVGTFTLRVKKDAVSGESKVSGQTSVKNGSRSIESEAVPVSITIQGGSAPKEEIIPTDAAVQKPAEESIPADAAVQKPGKESPNTAATGNAEEANEPEETVPVATEQESAQETAAQVTEEPAVETVPTETAAAPELPAQQEGPGGLLIPLVILAVCVAALVVILILKRKNR